MLNLKSQLIAPHSKLDWAECLLSRLEVETQSWLTSKPWKVSSRPLHPAGIEHWFFVLSPVPKAIGHTIADIIHNVRAPLDQMLTAYMAWSTGSHAGTRFPGIAFPTGRNKEDFDASLKLLGKKHLPHKAGEFLRTLECYAGGKSEWLHILHVIDRDDKHYPVAVPINTANTTTYTRDVKVDKGRVLRLGSPRGHHLVAEHPFGDGSNNLIKHDIRLRPIYQEVEGRGCLELPCPPGDMEFMTTTVGARFDGNVWPSIAVGIQSPSGQYLGTAEVVLRRYIDGTRAVLQDFEAAVGGAE